MYKAFKYRIYPTKRQQVVFSKNFGMVRFIYNLALETKICAWKSAKINLTSFDLINQMTALKKSGDCEWLKEAAHESLQLSILDLDKAYKNFYNGVCGFPKYKSKNSINSFRVWSSIRLNDKLYIPKFRKQNAIKINLHRPIEGKIKNVTISRTKTGKYFASILCETEEQPPNKPKIVKQTTVGVDLGIKTFLVTSNGEQIENPKHLRKAESRLKYLQRKYSKHKGKRTKQKLAKLHEKVANQRKDFLHKTSTKLIRENQSVAIEDLGVSNMLKNHNLAKSISDAGWGMFRLMLEYKSEWYGVNLLKIGRFDPSSKTCSNCGHINKELELKDRVWVCKSCFVTHDRDLNAAVNIRNFALKDI